MTRKLSLSCSAVLCLALLLFSVVCQAQNLSGNVVSVEDGDTITILTGTKQEVRIRLYGIDTPESAQAFGNNAKRFISEMVFGKQVRVQAYDKDKYGRTVGVVLLDGRNVNEEILRAGFAWQYRKYCLESFCPGWLTLEENARSTKIGLWRDSNPVAPWEWRKAARESDSTSSSASPLPATSVGPYHGNIKSHVLHAPGCHDYNCINCTASFSSVDEAMRSGYRMHKQCIR